MSGHSKFANIRAKKEKNDAAKGKIYTIIGREIAIAVREGGPDPNNNFKLKYVIQKAKANNMPNETIERGIKKASGAEGGADYQQLRYEGYGVGGVAIIVDTLTDNKNRTAANVKSAFTKGQGSLGTPNSVSFMFENKSQIIIDREEYEGTADDLMEVVLDAGAEDIKENEDSFEVLGAPEDLDNLRNALTEAGIPMVQAEIAMIPMNTVSVTDEQMVKNLRRTLDLLDEDDDVQTYYTNWEEE
jgi:YebC/PmpR family DNA-binding regulatory protein